ncbi:aromatic acid exporter family protein [Streptomyces europaeiscabiei]|uniref:aromatic acid exporter family protein n=1 Tax=Streptomyces europaeiscabiei TaxID=146819 RepID=UPI0039905D99
MAFVAPWVAVVLVESSVYRSFAHGLQQLGAIAVGTVVATGVALVLGSTMVTMALVLPTVLPLGQWRRLGSQSVVHHDNEAPQPLISLGTVSRS